MTSEALSTDQAMEQRSHPMRSNLRLAMIVGGSIDQERRMAAQRGEKPRIDELEMEASLGAKLYDFGWLRERAGKEWVARIALRAAKRFGRWSLWHAVGVVRATRSDDVVYATGEDVGLPLAALLRLSRRDRPHLIMRMEQWAKGRTPARRLLYNAYFSFGLKRIDLILCRTEAHMQLLKETFGVPPENLMLVPETIDVAFYSRSAPEAPVSTVDIPAGPYIVSAGLEMRDYETLIEAVRDLPVRLVIGAGSPWSKFHFSADRVPDLPGNVHVGSFNPMQMRELYRSAAIVVVPVRPTLRSCGITVVLEASAMQRPVIATRTVGLPDYIADNETGLLVKPSNVDDLRAKIVFLLANPDEAARLAENGHRRVVTELNQEQYVRLVRRAVDRVMERSRGRTKVEPAAGDDSN